jgi:1-deoxy-D-xylulose-5-phosphate reductoisomerase
VLNAANEMAVELFLQGKIGYRQIYQLCRQALDDNEFTPAPTRKQIFETDAKVRRQIRRLALAD